MRQRRLGSSMTSNWRDLAHGGHVHENQTFADHGSDPVAEKRRNGVEFHADPATE